MAVGVDIGGTFTDVVRSVRGQLHIHKLLSTPEHPAWAMLEGIHTIMGGRTQSLKLVAHGSTVATNAILERKGAKIALITTEGFRDLLYIGRQNRPDLYAIQPTIPTPLVPRERCFEMPERMDFDGNVLKKLTKRAIDRVLKEIEEHDVDAIAVCLLYSYVNLSHEQLIKERILARGKFEEWQIALSSEVLPEFREYERASTVTLEAYVRPIMTRYISQLQDELPAKCSLRIMQSDGGVMSAERVGQQAIYTALSGPAAGVIGAFHLAQLAGYDHIITLDMGGTSTDVALCPGSPQLSQESTIDGLPLRTRLIDIETIGAGGGSIARLDAGGALRVGPESAGANPGPIVYGQNGENLTVSDANAILGRLDPDHFLGGKMPLHLSQAQLAMESLAEQMGQSMMNTAKGIINIANVNIDRAIRRVSIARGHDPRQFTLVAFGGAGALHACEVAQRLEIPRVLVPQYPGVLCALGLLVADIRLDYTYAMIRAFSSELMGEMLRKQTEFLAMARDDLASEGIPAKDMEFSCKVDVRYAGQAYELTVPFAEDVVEQFHTLHQQTYGYALYDRPVEIVNFCLEAVGKVPKLKISPEEINESSVADAKIGEKSSPLGGSIALYERENLLPGMCLEGEALIFQLDSTIYIPPQWQARVDAYRNMILEQQ